MQDPIQEARLRMNRRHFFSKASLGLGALTLGNLLGCSKTRDNPSEEAVAAFTKRFHLPVKAKRIIYLFQSGGPSQYELYDYKPMLRQRHGEELPKSVQGEQRLTGMTAGQATKPMAGSLFGFKQWGKSGAWVSELMPHVGAIADDLCFVKTMHTEAINHDPAITFFQTGSQQAGRPSIGSWMSYGLGSDNENMPAFTVLLSRGAQRPQPIYSRLWGNGFLPSLHQGVQFRSGKDPVLYLRDPKGINGNARRRFLDELARLNELRLQDFGDPEIQSRIAQYEMAYRMQTSVPEVMDLKDEPDEVFELYGEAARRPGTYAANCLLARRLAERDVKFIQLYHLGWDQHTDLPREIASQCRDTDQASAALVTDLKRRGLLEDTLVIWGGEFGRTNFSQGTLTPTNYGRDHHPRAFTVWMAGAGIKPGISYGETDELGYNIIKDPVHVHDFQATLLHLAGVDHERLTFKHQGRRYRLTDVHGHVVKDILV
ncbi:MAG: DUF1501 domain-containing protein [Bacteroidota bacterium]